MTALKALSLALLHEEFIHVCMHPGPYMALAYEGNYVKQHSFLNINVKYGVNECVTV